MYSLQHPQIDESFLQLNSKVEEVTTLLRSMIKPSEEEVEAATFKKETTADGVTDDNFMVTKRPSDTSINNDRFTFMRQVEVDQDERSKARLERERVAQNFRKLGNANYRQEKFENAIAMYSQAIENIKDSPVLYINRALCFIKLGNFKRAIIDCDFVLNKLDEKNLRSWLYRAMAYKSLNDEANYENCIKYVRKYHSKQMEFIDTFIEKMKATL
ncbi:tetratricopeptide repeat protein 12 [Drosophila sulfurigaster albostrigata]|uniref:tetratricopeptide repeat protein 12 n=1 Tax=Drosophila sulfurigaster albostrigata TaxID=89887 RepID=UPI002D218F46|nr:tetratricopeptide repeat protein 12 [Drosophila sulfurigaster albostrigata]